MSPAAQGPRGPAAPLPPPTGRGLRVLQPSLSACSRGKGPLKNTSDVISAAKKIAEAGSRMDKLGRTIADHVSDGLARGPPGSSWGSGSPVGVTVFSHEALLLTCHPARFCISVVVRISQFLFLLRLVL